MMNLAAIIWTSLIATVGIITNIPVFLTYCRKTRLNHIQCIILILAASDILGCVVLIILNIINNMGTAYCYFALFALACACTFSLFLSAYVSVDRYKAQLHIGTLTSTSNKKTVMICLLLGIITIFISAPIFYFIDDEYPACIKPIAHSAYGVKLLLFQLKNLIGVVIIIIYNTKIFLLARKRQNLINPQSNIEQSESNPHHDDDNQWAQHMANQQNPVKLTNITSLFLASDLQLESSVSHKATTSSYAAHTSEQQVTTENFRPDMMNLNLNVPSTITDDTETELHSIKLEVVDNDSQTVHAENQSSTGLSTIQAETDTHTNAHDNPTRESGITTFNHVTKMLFCVNVVAVATHLPFLVIAFFWFPHIFQLQEQNKALYIFCLMLRDLKLVNFATNPILYCIINKSFRLDCKAAIHQITRL